ncbi:hypothetical protein [Microbacter margulisiae]|uniref:Uncharacterized protein n=1 Tax=Microbacter margulisiae TaxID=1350067 RepID=A0A7W5DSF3_9PORP|nr:hypothetical protein [Microbacter margulisiae]MBB3188219.1 hypothetical protein [Microbacter margulisiae]
MMRSDILILMTMKRFVVRNLFALILFVVALVVILAFGVSKGVLPVLLMSLAVIVLSSSLVRFLKLTKGQTFDPVINFDEQRIECKQTGKILYQFTTGEWANLSLDEKFDMIRWFKFA